MRLFFCILLFPLLCFSQQKNVFDVAKNGSIEEMKLLIEQNKDTINAKNQNGFTPLLLACYRGNTAVAEFLINKVKNIDEMTAEGTALVASVYKGDKIISEKLLKKGANPNLQSAQGITALMYAVQIQNIDLVKLLLNYKADKKIADKSGKKAFEYAIFNKNKELINLLKN